VEIASDLPSEEFGDCIAHLVAGNLIESATLRPGIFGRLSGKEDRYFYWAMQLGRAFLTRQSEDDTPETIIPPTTTTAR
jgi:hypothetical protein